MVPVAGVRGLVFTTEAVSTPKTLQTSPSLLDCPSLMSWSQWEVQDALWSHIGHYGDRSTGTNRHSGVDDYLEDDES
ncbi:hypothetical protein EYF80_021752 [Liparis tanakae]|uniref:Uncharacterized protein n=1 Tax=Liparis tanakae TaxID=230148 RepID=A0A4Z2HQP3_9TELE|nr:hypothetical protein EYF80_021752 [Liparis tanakae]